MIPIVLLFALIAGFANAVNAVNTASAANAFEIALDKPAAGASVAPGLNKFEFVASGKSPLSCALLVGGVAGSVAAANVTAYRNLPVSIEANVASGVNSWRVECTDADGAQAASEERAFSVVSETAASPAVSPAASPAASPTASLPSASPAPAQPLPENAGIISAFVVSAGGEKEENALIASWRSSPGRKVEFAALFSNEGANELNVSLEVIVFNETLSGLVVASLESESVLVPPGEERVLKASWVPRSEGAFVAQATVFDASAVDGAGVANAGGVEFGKSYLQLNVARQANADWLFLLAIACIAVLCLAVFKTQSNARSIRGGGLK